MTVTYKDDRNNIGCYALAILKIAGANDVKDQEEY